MLNYKTMYLRLFNAITDALEDLARGNVPRAADILRRAQQETEEMYIDIEEGNR